MKKQYRIKVLLPLLTLICVFLFIGSLGRDRSDLIVTMLDVGHGDAAVVHFPNGNTLLIDGGECTSNFDHGLQTVLPYLKERGRLHLTYALITHGHNDHAGGVINLLNRVQIDTVVISDCRYHSAIEDQIIGMSQKHHIALRKVSRGDCLYPDPACRLYILHPWKYDSTSSATSLSSNDQSIVLKLQYGAAGVLFTGDIEEKALASVLEFGDFLECELIKLPHHGSMVQKTYDLLRKVNPLVAVASVSAYRRFNLPSHALVQFCKTNDVPLLQTGHEGAIMFEVAANSIRRINWR